MLLQILTTDPRTVFQRISWENLIKNWNYFPFGDHFINSGNLSCVTRAQLVRMSGGRGYEYSRLIYTHY